MRTWNVSGAFLQGCMWMHISKVCDGCLNYSLQSKSLKVSHLSETCNCSLQVASSSGDFLLFKLSTPDAFPSWDERYQQVTRGHAVNHEVKSCLFDTDPWKSFCQLEVLSRKLLFMFQKFYKKPPNYDSEPVIVPNSENFAKPHKQQLIPFGCFQK